MKFRISKGYDSCDKFDFQEAKSRSYPVYWDGLPCKNGHIAHRYINSGKCVECVKNLNSKVRYGNYAGELKSTGINMDIRRALEDKKLERELGLDDY